LANTTGDFNTAIGYRALDSATGGANTALGFQAGSSLTTGNNNIEIANTGDAAHSSTIRIGLNQSKTFVAGINGATIAAGAAPVFVDVNDQLGTISSSRRFKKEIQPMNKASEAILALKPVTFHYKSDLTNTAQFGLVAEDVAEGNSDLVVRDKSGQIYTVRYDAVNAMLLNEFLKEHRKVGEQQAAIAELKATVRRQEATIARQQKGIEDVTARLDEQSVQIQKMIAQHSLSKPAPQTVLNSR
jgi:trimeric autotransporter adhesin